MVPDIASKGHSFKGAMGYYLHDKREGEGPHPATAERVAWTETRNLATDDPHLAMRVMVATAKDSDRLKAEAGVKNTGRKSNAHVYAYSLAWHPDEAGTLDRAEMRRAVDASLKALGAEHLQAVLVCHRDQKHPHMHVILNRVDPATGKMHPFSNDRLVLSDWANKYERERGQILTPMREEKRQLREQFSQAERRENVEQRPKPAPSPAVMLRDFGNAQKVAHSQQWVELSAQHKATSNAIYATCQAKIADEFKRYKAQTKDAWGQYFCEARAEQKIFTDREKFFAGRIRNALDAVTHQKITGQAGDRGRLALTFNNVLSSQARSTAFAEKQAIGQAAFNKALRAEVDGKTIALRNERAAALEKHRGAFTVNREALIVKQNAEREKLREAWAQLKSQRQAQDKGRSEFVRTKPDIDPKAKREAAQESYQARRSNFATKAWKRGQERPRPIVHLPEKPAMKNEWDKQARIPEPVKPSAPMHVAPVKVVQVSVPSPAPSPSGVVRSPEQRAANVPRVDPVKEWAKTQDKPTPQARKDWSKSAEPPAPAPAPKKDWSQSAKPATTEPAPKKDWGAAAKATPAPEPLPTRSRDYDRDR